MRSAVTTYVGLVHSSPTQASSQYFSAVVKMMLGLGMVASFHVAWVSGPGLDGQRLRHTVAIGLNQFNGQAIGQLQPVAALWQFFDTPAVRLSQGQLQILHHDAQMRQPARVIAG